jgi:hypothetical protein
MTVVHGGSYSILYDFPVIAFSGSAKNQGYSVFRYTIFSHPVGCGGDG